MRKKFDEFFQSEHRAWVKILGGAVIVPLLVVPMGLRNRGSSDLQLSSSGIVGFALGASLFGAVITALFCLKDYVERRQNAGLSVPRALHVAFGMGMWSVVLWSPLIGGAIVTTLILVMDFF
jgi:hypothetical protein